MNHTLKKTITYFVIALVFISFIFITISFQIPAIKRRIIFFAIWFVAELYLWDNLNTSFHLLSNFSKNKWLKISFIFLYWLPIIIIFCLLIGLNIYGIKSMSGGLYNNVMGCCIIVCLVKLIAATLLCIYNLITFIISLLHRESDHIKKRIEDGRKLLLKIIFVLCLFLLSLMFYGMVVGANHIIIKHIDLQSNHKAFADQELRIVQLSDLHLGTWTSTNTIEKMVAMTNGLNPDMIMITGDLVQNTSKEIEACKNILCRLKSKYGVYSVLGNHDYAKYARFDSPAERAKDMQNLIDLQESIGWNVLQNENLKVAIHDGNDTIVMVGIEYWSPKKMFFNVGKIEPSFEGVQDRDYVIFLSHDPQIWDEVKRRPLPADLTLSGHTHGMQIGIDKAPIHFSPVQLLYKEWGGLYVNEKKPDQYLYINVGMGSAGIPARIGIYPEITEITISR